MAIFGDSRTAAGFTQTTGTDSGNGWRMLKVISLSLVLVVAVLILPLTAGCGGEERTANSAEAIDTGGRLQLTETTFDDGSVPVGEKVEHGFIINNTGTGPLEMGQMDVKLLEGC